MASNIISIKKTLIINAPVSTVFEFWSNFRNFTKFIWLVESVEILDNKRSRWIIKAPLNKKVEFDSEIKESLQNSSIVWESNHFAANSRGDIKFFRHGKGTRVNLIFSYSIKHPRVHELARLVSRFGFPSITFDEGLRKAWNWVQNDPIYAERFPILKRV